MPEVASPQVKLTVGAPVFWLYQPVLAGLAGVRLAVIVGRVVSILKVALCTWASILPAGSTLAAYRVCMPSLSMLAPGLRYGQGVLGSAATFAGGELGSRAHRVWIPLVSSVSGAD